MPPPPPHCAAPSSAAVSQIYETFRLMLLLLWISTASAAAASWSYKSGGELRHSPGTWSKWNLLQFNINYHRHCRYRRAAVAVAAALPSPSPSPPRRRRWQCSAVTKDEWSYEVNSSSKTPFFNWPRIFLILVSYNQGGITISIS